MVSPPMRRRGLKPRDVSLHASIHLVASHAEAWIETLFVSVDGGVSQVASHAEAWIETAWSIGRGRIWAGRLPCGGVD